MNGTQIVRLAPQELPPQERRISPDSEGVYRHPLVACISPSGEDISAVDVFPEVMHAQYPSELHLPDYDIIVSFGIPVNGAECPVVIFGDAAGQHLAHSDEARLNAIWHGRMVRDGYVVGTSKYAFGSIYQVNTTEEPWASLVKEGISSAIESNRDGLLSISTSNFVLQDARGEFVYAEPPAEALIPLMHFRDGAVLAARSMTQERFPLLMLPSWTMNKRAWLLAAWRAWVADGTLEVPLPSDGFELRDWMTAAEIAEFDAMRELEAELRNVTSSLSEKIHQARGRLEVASSVAESGMRRLLTQQGEELERAVHHAFSVLGFHVESRDLEGKARLEDLRVSSPGLEWTAVVEVKGYTNGGKSNDFNKFIRYNAEYVRETRKAPDRNWYVVNAYISKSLGSRPGPFDSVPDAVQSFADANGLVVSTVELFRLIRSVEIGEVSTERARESLVNSTGFYVAPDDGGSVPIVSVNE
ncbi:hypothetical protein NJC10_06615 [Micrococcus sp. M4NT]|uniref:hypothetical protein n=1 Tax=Micrococcus sp. M4NT TaxID=2957501 RepID=UPI0029BF4365|nr:hypothetical protein [Micrococcus sp. M4NT]MDX2341337.1 hypothetical protein [Micrococcus sp. M4NT]